MIAAPSDNVFGIGGVYMAGCLLVYGMALLAGWLLPRPSLAHSAVFALDASFENIVFLGVTCWARQLRRWRCSVSELRCPPLRGSLCGKPCWRRG
jgi:predicted permease